MAPATSTLVVSLAESSLEVSLGKVHDAVPRRTRLTCSHQSKLKVQLKLSITRLRMVQQKDEAIAKQQRRAMAQLLEVGRTLAPSRTATHAS